MTRITGTIPARVKSRQPSARAPMSFRFVADVRVAPAKAIAEAQGRRDAQWDCFTAWVLAHGEKSAAVAS